MLFVRIFGMNRGSLSFGAFIFICVVVSCTSVALAQALPDGEQESGASHSSITPDVRGEELPIKIERGNFVIVPIPISDPTLGTALVVGAAYFFGQTEEQKETQPASVIGGGAMYSDTDSYAVAVGGESYWHEDTWRFAGAIGYADLKLELLAPDTSSSGIGADWQVQGGFLYAHLARKFTGRWYVGGFIRSIDATQNFSIDLSQSEFDVSGETVSSGLGAFIQRDGRDMPTNAYEGNYFNLSGLFNNKTFGSDSNYQSYSIEYSSYHELTDHVVLAWQVAGCHRSGTVPLWDACTVGLRGFAATDYLGDSSARGQVEARWRVSQRWGFVGFAGAGYMDNSFSQVNEFDPIPSYGVGVRFMVLKSKRINIRLDYGRSEDSDAIHLSVGEAF